MIIRAYIDGWNLDIAKQLGKVRNPDLWKFAAAEWLRLYTPYVPMDTGTLASNVAIRSTPGVGEITHTVPYARYQYHGEAYGPAFPVFQNGVIVGYRSPRGKPKHPIGKKLKYKRDLHPLATSEWDQAARPVQMPKLVRAMQKYIERRI